MRGLTALAIAVLGAALLAASASATERTAAYTSEGTAAYKFYVGCGVSEKVTPAHSCPRSSKKGAYFESLNANVFYTVCVRFPKGSHRCKAHQLATKETLYVNKITSFELGKHKVSWFVSGKRVGSYAFTVRK